MRDIKIKNQATYFNNSGFMPPQSVDLEKIVLSACLNGDHDVIFAYIKSDNEFYNSAHKIIFSAIQEMSLDQIDITTYQLRRYIKENIELVGGIHYLLELSKIFYSKIDLIKICFELIEKAIARETIILCSEITRDLTIQNQSDVFGVIEKINGHNIEILQRISSLKTFNFEASKNNVIKNTIEKHNGTGDESIKTLIRKIDNYTGGFRRKSLNVIGARPGAGKSGLAIQLAHNFSEKQNFKTLIFSLEMSESENIERLLANHLSLTTKDRYTNFEIIKGFINDKEKLNSFVEGAEKFTNNRIFIYDNIFNIDNIRAKTIELVKSKSIDVVIIDHLHIIKSHEQNEIDRLTAISGKLKVLAKECNVPVICLAQLNREVEKRTDKKPILSDLRGSGSIEQDSDTVSFIYRPYYYDQENSDENQLYYIVSKNRNGACGELTLWCDVKNSTVLDEAPQYQISLKDIKSSFF